MKQRKKADQQFRSFPLFHFSRCVSLLLFRRVALVVPAVSQL